MRNRALACLAVCLAILLSACGGGGGGGSSGSSSSSQSSNQTQGVQPGRTLEFSAQYTAGSLTAPSGLPDYVKTIIADFNGDGRNDVAVFTNATANGSDLVVMYQAPDGTFQTAVAFNSVTDLGLLTIRDIAAGDLNSDGRSDLAILGIPLPQAANYGPPLVVLHQDSTGVFQSPTAYDVSPLASTGGRLAIGDLNADSRSDVVIGGNPATVVLQAPDGTLGSAPSSVFSVNANTYLVYDGELHIADMNSDGFNDLVFQEGAKGLGILRQTSPGVFASSIDHYQVTTSYWSSFNTFAIGDVNGDGKSDVVVLDPGTNGYLNIFLQNSIGTLDAPQLVTTESSLLYGIEIADIDKDGLNDIVGDVVEPALPSGRGQVHVLYQAPNHTFQKSTIFRFPTIAGGGSAYSQSLSIGDVNSDGWPDAVVAWSSEGIFVLTNSAN